MDSASIAPGIATAPRAAMPRALNIPHPHVPTPVRAPVAANDVHVGSVIAAEDAANVRAVGREAKPEDPQIALMKSRAGTLGTVGMVAGLGFQAEAMGQMNGMLRLHERIGIRNMPRLQYHTSKIFTVFGRAHRGTNVADAFHIRENYLREAAMSAEAKGLTEKAAKKMAQAEAWAGHAEKMEGFVGKAFAPIRNAGGSALDAFSGTGIGGKVTGWFNKGAQSRITKVKAKHAASLENALAAGQGKLPGFWARTKAALTFKQAEMLEGVTMPHELSEFADRIEAAKGFSGERLTEHLVKLRGEMHGKVHGGQLSKEAQHASVEMLTHVEKAARSASALEGYAKAATGTMRNVLKAGFATLGRGNLLITGAVVASTAALAARSYEHRAANREHGAIVDEVAKAANDNGSEFIKNLRGENHKQGGTEWVRSGSRIIGETSLVAMARAANGGGAAMMIPQMATMPIDMMGIKNNEVLEEANKLLKHSRGEIDLSEQDQIVATRHLLTCVPEVHGSKFGYYDKQAAPTARALVKQFPKFEDRIAVMADPTKFAEFRKGVIAEQMAEAKAKTANDDGKGELNAKPAISPKAAAEAAYHAAEKPQMAVIHGKAAHEGTEHHGRAVNAQRQVG